MHDAQRGRSTSEYKRQSIRALLDELQSGAIGDTDTESDFRFHVYDDNKANVNAMQAELNAHPAKARRGSDLRVFHVTRTEIVQRSKPSDSDGGFRLPKIESSPLQLARAVQGRCCTPQFVSSTTALTQVVAAEWLQILVNCGALSEQASKAKGARDAVVIPFGSTLLNRRSDVDICLIGATPLKSALPALQCLVLVMVVIRLSFFFFFFFFFFFRKLVGLAGWVFDAQQKQRRRSQIRRCSVANLFSSPWLATCHVCLRALPIDALGVEFDFVLCCLQQLRPCKTGWRML